MAACSVCWASQRLKQIGKLILLIIFNIIIPRIIEVIIT